MGKNQGPYICFLKEIYFRPIAIYRLKVKGWEKIFHAHRNCKNAGVVIFISGKRDFKAQTVTRDKEGHYIMIKSSIQEEDIAIINIYAPNTEAPQYVRQIQTNIKGEIDSNKINSGRL